MNPREFFKSHHWWGKFFGALFGYLIFGPTGALFGILIGNLFDRGLTEHFTRPYWLYHTEKRESVKTAFCQATFSIMGHIAKAGGRVTESHISAAKKLMTDLNLTKQQRATAQNFFRAGASVDFDLLQALTQLRSATRDNPNLLRLFVDLQFQTALIEGLSPKKQQLLNTTLTFLGYAPLDQQQRFYEDFSTRPHHERRSNENYGYHNFNANTPSNEIDRAYNTLGINRSASKQEMKRAYRRLISQNHPDKLIARGMPESMIKAANERTQKIRKAYELLQKLDS